MKVYLMYNGFCQNVRTSRGTGTVEKTVALTLNKESIHAWLDEKECNTFKYHLDAEGFWNQPQTLSVNLKINPSKKRKMQLQIEGNCLAELCRIFGSDIKLQVIIEDDNEEILLNSKEMGIISSDIPSCNICKRPKYDAYCGNGLFENDIDIITWISGVDTELWISIGITGSFHRSITDTDVLNKSSLNAKILNQMIGTDVDIYAKNGTSISCHKAFLMAQSPVFAAMYVKGFKQSNSSIIKTDIPGESLKPFLDYIYFYEVSGPIEDSQIAIDLLQAGHKYDIKPMITKMTKILLGSPTVIFTPDEAIRLYLFVRNVETFHNLKMKAIKILKRFERRAVSESEEFNKLFSSPTASVAAKELMLDVIWN